MKNYIRYALFNYLKTEILYTLKFFVLKRKYTDFVYAASAASPLPDKCMYGMILNYYY